MQVKTAFNGLVEFHVTYRTPMSDLTSNAILEAVPEAKDWTGNMLSMKNALAVLAWRFPTTCEVVYLGDLKEMPAELKDFLLFWEVSRAMEGDYRALWEKFKTVSYAISDEWWKMEYKDDRILAPPELKKEAAKDPNS